MFDTGPGNGCRCSAVRSLELALDLPQVPPDPVDASVDVGAGKTPGFADLPDQQEGQSSWCSLSASTASETRDRRSSRSTFAQGRARHRRSRRPQPLRRDRPAADRGWACRQRRSRGHRGSRCGATPRGSGCAAGPSRTPRARPACSARTSPTMRFRASTATSSLTPLLWATEAGNSPSPRFRWERRGAPSQGGKRMATGRPPCLPGEWVSLRHGPPNWSGRPRRTTSSPTRRSTDPDPRGSR